ncbi:hypothetical protein C5U62_31715 [Pseudomonas protegens]|uniref:N-terminal domain-containing protein n=2 Tax=Pseudomonas protegens TaxID=380021 RepID=A0A2T6GBK2_9PSED|nr:hypothetical protein C5U62_31715 [Pseudomonas protegens]
MGIPSEDIKPRVNVFTFNAWKALGRVVKKGQHGVKIVTVIPCTKKDEATGESVPVKKVKTTTVFHISQTEALDAAEVTPVVIVPLANQVPVSIAQPVETVVSLEVAEPRPLNAYELKQQARRERYEDRAADAQAASAATYRRARDMASLIPFGQPILVGHHSERRDRNYRDKIHTTFGKSFALQDKAEYYAQKAKRVGAGGISSDDPDAVDKLAAKLAGLERSQELMKSANKVIRARSDSETKITALIGLGFSAERAAELLEKDFAGRMGFPAYALSNNNAVIKSTKDRIAALQAQQRRADVERQADGYIYREDTSENRVMFVFEGKPDEATRKILKDHAFNWSPSRRAWVRKLNNAGILSAQQVMANLVAEGGTA